MVSHFPCFASVENERTKVGIDLPSDNYDEAGRRA